MSDADMDNNLQQKYDIKSLGFQNNPAAQNFITEIKDEN
jgi:hypothetical protein